MVAAKQKFAGPIAQVAAGDIININPVFPVRVVVRTGDGVIDAAQKAELQRLVKEWVTARQQVRRGGFTYAAAWGAFNAAMAVNKYDELPMDRFGDARSWLMRQMGILKGMKSAPKRLPNWRNSTIAAIKARCRNQLGDQYAYIAFIGDRFGKQSLTQLADDELQKTKAHVWAIKPAG